MAITLPPEAMARMFDARPDNDLPTGERFNVCPTQTLAVCTAEAGGRRLRAMRWGFVPQWYRSPTDGPLLINARAETIAEKPAFRAAARARRCLIAADGYYEWTRPPEARPLPWYIRRADDTPMALAGVWQEWEPEGQHLATCAILTCAAGPAISALHDREPVVIEPADWPLWLGEAGHGAAVLMRPTAAGVLRWHRVGTAVNSNRAEGEALRAPLPEPEA